LIEQIERELHPTGSVIIRVETFATDGANTGSAPV
jgi:hypothetical protein